jgi:hypothetical protein
MDKNPEILLYGKTVRLNMKESLLPDMTYTFEFGSVIADLNEGNVFEGFTYVFSTGAHIDSLSFSGRIINAFDLKPAGKEDRTPTWVMLYSDTNDSIVYKSMPTYIAKADAFGFFNFDNVRDGTYLIFALRDMGSRLLFDMPNERIAFSDTLIILDNRHYRGADSIHRITAKSMPDSIKERYPSRIHTDIVMYQFEEEQTRQQRISFERSEANKMRFVYSMPVDLDSFAINIIDYEFDNRWYELEISANRDTLDYWISDTTLINQRLLLVHLYSPRTDSLNNLIYTNDTLRLSFDPPRQAASGGRGGRRGGQNDAANQPPQRTPVETMTITPNIRSGGTIDLNNRIRLTASQPIKDVDIEMISLVEMFDTIRHEVDFEFIRDTLSIRQAYIEWQIKEETRYILIIDSMAFKSIYNVDNDSIGINFSSQRMDFYSTIELTFDDIPCPLIIQLIKGAKEDIVKEIILDVHQDKTVIFNFIAPDTYGLKLIHDRNGNGKWDTGNYLQKIQPEKVEYFREAEIVTTSGETTKLQWNFLYVKVEEDDIDEDEDDTLTP